MKALTLITILSAFLLVIQSPEYKNKVLTLYPSTDTTLYMTTVIQKAIDSCAALGGGTVILRKGMFISGTIELKSNIILKLDKGSVLKGSDQYSDYRNDSFIYGRDISGIRIQGKGIIDGVDCYNPKGEEGFRGPHCIRLINCNNIDIEGITIVRSANWAINCRYCAGGRVRNVKIRGGHDGLHTRFCSGFRVSGCDFRTGDDAFAGNDNRNFVIKGCRINTSCNAFRFGCDTLLVVNCLIWGPGEYVHKIQKRNNTLSAFVHFSPADQKPQIRSGNWLVRKIKVRNVDSFYNYNFENGLWQTGQPVTNIIFERIKAEGILRAFNIKADKAREFNLIIRNSFFSSRENHGVSAYIFEGVRAESDAFFYASDFGRVELYNVAIKNPGDGLIIECKSGNYLNPGIKDFEILNNQRRIRFENIGVIIPGR